MMLALGVFGYAVAVFHLFTHAFFKALLFLGSGSVNHAHQHVRHAPHGRPAHDDADHLLDVPDRHAQPLRRLPPRRVLVQGRDPAGGVGEQPRPLYRRRHRLLRDRALHVPRRLPHLLRGVQGRRARGPRGRGLALPRRPRPPARIGLGDDRPPAHPHGGRDRGGLVGLGQGVPSLRGGGRPPPPRCTRPPDFSYGIAITSSIIAVAGIASAWAIYHRGLVSAAEIRKTAYPLAALLERKFFLDDLYERAFALHVFQRGWNRLVEVFDTRAVDGAVNGTGWLGRAIEPRPAPRPDRAGAALRRGPRPRRLRRRHHRLHRESAVGGLGDAVDRARVPARLRGAAGPAAARRSRPPRPLGRAAGLAGRARPLPRPLLPVRERRRLPVRRPRRLDRRRLLRGPVLPRRGRA